jgi:hypothetical protein
VADQPAGVRVHVVPAVEDAKGGREGVEAGAEVGEQDLDARQAAGAEPVGVEGGAWFDR